MTTKNTKHIEIKYSIQELLYVRQLRTAQAKKATQAVSTLELIALDTQKNVVGQVPAVNCPAPPPGKGHRINQTHNYVLQVRYTFPLTNQCEERYIIRPM